MFVQSYADVLAIADGGSDAPPPMALECLADERPRKCQQTDAAAQAFGAQAFGAEVFAGGRQWTPHPDGPWGTGGAELSRARGRRDGFVRHPWYAGRVVAQPLGRM